MSDESPGAARDDLTAGPPGPESAPPTGGFAALARRHPRVVIAVGVSVAVTLLTGSALAAGVALAPPTAARSSPSDPAATDSPDRKRPVPDDVAEPARVRTCSVSGPAADPRLKSFQGSVRDAATGELLFDRAGGAPARTADTLQVVTAAAALSVLGPDFRITTSMVDAGPEAVALIGRGDATLSALPAGEESVYPGAPKLADLATATLERWAATRPGQQIRSVALDASYWSEADSWDSSWPRTEQTIGHLSEVTALQVDGDRSDPRRTTSPRSTDPVAAAGKAVVAALKAADPGGLVDPALVATPASAPAGAPVLAEVASQPVSALVTQMLLPGDQTLAEMLARIVSRQAGSDGTAASLTDVYATALAKYGIPTTGFVIRDGSGLSPENGVPADYLTQLMAQVHGGANGLAAVAPGLSVSGETGVLASRFTGSNASARGEVLGTAGMIASEYSLTGIITARDDTVLVATFFAIGDGIGPDAKVALDALAAAVHGCGGNLSPY